MDRASFWKWFLVAALVLSLTAFILGWIGFGVPDWHKFQRYNNTIVEYYGLWAYCQEQSPLFDAICQRWPTAEKELFAGSRPSFIRTTEGLMTTGMVILSLGLFIGILAALLPLLAYLAAILALIAFIFLVVGLPIFGRQSSIYSRVRGDYSYTKRYGFWLMVPTIVLEFLAILFFAAAGFLYKKYGYGNIANSFNNKSHYLRDNNVYGGKQKLGLPSFLTGPSVIPAPVPIPYGVRPPYAIGGNRPPPNPYLTTQTMTEPSLLSQYLAQRVTPLYESAPIQLTSGSLLPQPTIARVVSGRGLNNVTPSYYRFGEPVGPQFTPIINYSDYSQEFQPIWISLSLISIIMFTVGGNSLVCIAVIRERHLQNTTNYFLTSLALTDCLVACLVMPLAVAVEFIGHFPFDSLTCNIWLTFDVCCCTSSIWHMRYVMSLNRYLTLRYPLKYGRNKRRSFVTYKIMIIWLISFAICLPLFILGLTDSSNVYNKETRACFAAHRIFKIYGSFVAFFIPLIIMIVTYALTMSALQQAHATKQQRTRRRKKIHAVVNLAAMAIKWKRAVNTVEILDEKNLSINLQHNIPSIEKRMSISEQRKRSSSLLSVGEPKKTIFISNHCLNESSQPISSLTHREKQLELSEEKSIHQSSNQRLYPITPNSLQAPTKRSNSCTPLLEVKNARRSRRRSSSVHTLLQIRRNSAEITKELAHLSAQLSASMTNDGIANKRLSLSIPNTYESNEHGTPTIDQLLAEISVNQPIIIPSSFLTVNPKRRRRSNSADIRLPITEFYARKESVPNLTIPDIPDLLVTSESSQNSSCNNLESLEHHSNIDTACQRIKDWITVTSSSTNLNHDHNSKLSTRCVSANNFTEHTPMLTGNKQHCSTLTNLQRHFPHIEQLYGQTSTLNSTFHPQQQQHQQQHLLVNDHVASVQNFATEKRASVCSLTSSLINSRFSRNNRPSTSSSIGSSSLQGTIRKVRPRLHDIVSQVSFQMVSLDTDDTSSCTSSFTHHSAHLKSVRLGPANSLPNNTFNKKRQRFKSLVKKSASNERKAMRVLLIIFCIFVILWTPFFVINLVSCFITEIHPVLASVATWLGYCSSCANPIIYTIFSRTFRQAFVNILTCRKTMNSHPSSQMFSPSAYSKSMSVGRKLSAMTKGQFDIR
ncbi:unnamed protein product [Adineta steineri]|uniref:G-protein coupled receptors family 1 profile domain-containing protein n=1 Tax=Adineta steineri TaxID=433720 RepID=A0A815FZP7_9BILA|nr:unnamed protein product [Adineta steineri]CAF1589773.1 unnamed protein product [Adineta steineri]